MSDKFPAPWQLKGYGFAIVYQLNRREALKYTPNFLKGTFSGGLGAIVIANYEDSDVGPYSEILFIPGKFNKFGEDYRTIESIFVSSKDAKEGGINNWGIPKKQADFHWETLASGHEQLIVSKDGEQIIRLKFKLRKLKMPFNARWIKTPLIQMRNDSLVQVRLKGAGSVRHADLIAIEVNEDLFPDLSQKSPIVTAKIEAFNIRFPRAKKVKAKSKWIKLEKEKDQKAKLVEEKREQKKLKKQEKKIAKN